MAWGHMSRGQRYVVSPLRWHTSILASLFWRELDLADLAIWRLAVVWRFAYIFARSID